MEYRYQEGGKSKVIKDTDIVKATGITLSGANNRIRQLKKGIYSPAQVLDRVISVPPKRYKMPWDEECTVGEVMTAIGLTRNAAYSRLMRAIKGKITRKELFAKPGAHSYKYESTGEEMNEKQRETMKELEMTPEQLRNHKRYYPE